MHASVDSLSPARSGPIDITIENRLEAVGAHAWNELWRRSEAPGVFACFEWADAWWRHFGAARELRLYIARRDARLVGILPTSWPELRHSRSEAVVLVGDEHSDYASVLADPAWKGVLPALIDRVCLDLPADGSLLVRDVRSDTTLALHLELRSRALLGSWLIQSRVPCPRSSLNPERLEAIVSKDSLRRHARKLARHGRVDIAHWTAASDILPRLDAFFALHVDRWAGSRWPSLFLKDDNRAFYRDLVVGLSSSGQLVFSELSVDGAPAAFHFGFISEGDFIWYKPAFDPRLSKFGPGEVLLRELFLFAAARGLAGFDFTRGDETFKRRFCDMERETLTFRYHARRTAALTARSRAWLRERLRGTNATRAR